jgi:hypothetical protein
MPFNAFLFGNGIMIICSDLTKCKNIENLICKTISKIVDHAQGQGENRFKSGAYTLVFEHFESVFNAAIGY